MREVNKRNTMRNGVTVTSNSHTLLHEIFAYI